MKDATAIETEALKRIYGFVTDLPRKADDFTYHRGISLVQQLLIAVIKRTDYPSAIIIFMMEKKLFWTLAAACRPHDMNGRIVLTKSPRNPQGISPLADHARKRAQGSPRLCNHDYAATYVEVHRQVRPYISST